VALEGGEEVSLVDLGGGRRGEAAPPYPSLDWEGWLRRVEVAIMGGKPGDQWATTRVGKEVWIPCYIHMFALWASASCANGPLW
jgi:hypothetical protein